MAKAKQRKPIKDLAPKKIGPQKADQVKGGASTMTKTQIVKSISDLH